MPSGPLSERYLVNLRIIEPVFQSYYPTIYLSITGFYIAARAVD